MLGAASSKHFKLNSVFDVKSLCNKVLKQLREELALAQTTQIKIINADLIEFESN